MKKQRFSIPVAVIAVLVVLLAVVYAIPKDPPATEPSTTTQPTTAAPTLPATTVLPTTGSTGAQTTVSSTPASTTVPPEPGEVWFYTCDTDNYAVYLSLASDYHAETGIEIHILTPPEGTGCEEALLSYLSGDTPPTIFCIHTPEMLAQVRSKLYDLQGTAVVQALYSDSFALAEGDKLLALAADVAGSGLIYNASKLASAGFTETDIRSFAGLKTTVSHITSNRNTLGYAFAAPDFSDEHLMMHLAGLYPDTDQLHAFIDLYFKNCTVQTTTLKYFLNGTTVFYIGGTADYSEVAAIGSNKLGFLPAYSEDTAAVQCFSDHYWAMHSDASEADIQAALAFWLWLVSDRDGEAPIDQLGMLSPYRQATHASNVLEQILRNYISNGNVYLTWGLSGEVTDAEAFTAALKAYKSSPTEENWASVAALFTEQSTATS